MSDVWLELLHRHTHNQVDRPLEEGEVVLSHFQVPSLGAMHVAVRWLAVNGADVDFARLALSQAMKEAVDEDQDWLAALHKVVNRHVRQNTVGWTGYNGNWVDMVQAVKKFVESEKGERASEDQL